MGASASAHVLSSYTSPSGRIAKPLLAAFANRRVAVISYQDQHAQITEREIELQYLYYNLPVWYALAWDRLRHDVRSFRIDRITTIQLLPETFPLRREQRFIAAGEPDARRCEELGIQPCPDQSHAKGRSAAACAGVNRPP